MKNAEDQRAKYLKKLNEQEKFMHLWKIYRNLSEFIKYCLPNTTIPKKQQDEFEHQKNDIRVILHDVKYRLDSLLVGKWDKEPELIEFKCFERKNGTTDNLAS